MMRMAARLPSALTLAVACLACAVGVGNGDEQASPSNTIEEQTVQPSADRPAPPVVPPVDKDGIRYEQQETGEPGILQATRIATGEVLWELQVYRIRKQTVDIEPMPVYFASMTLGPGPETLTIENES